MTTEKKMIMYDSPEAATRKTVTGWVSANGHYWGNDEHMARYDGSTHKLCDCGTVIEKNSWCAPCHARRKREVYEKAERKPWDGVCMLYSEAYDKWFTDPTAVEEFVGFKNDGLSPGLHITQESLMLYLSEPNRASQCELDSEHFCDVLPEDECDLPGDIEDAIAAFNQVLREHTTPLSWRVSDVAAMLPLVEKVSAV